MLIIIFSELIGGTPSLKINHGSGTLVLQLTNNVGVADRRWHRLDVRSNSKVRHAHSSQIPLHVFPIFFPSTQKISDFNTYIPQFLESARQRYTHISTHELEMTSLFTLAQFKGSALYSGSMFHCNCHGDRRRRLVGNDRGPLIL